MSLAQSNQMEIDTTSEVDFDQGAGRDQDMKMTIVAGSDDPANPIPRKGMCGTTILAIVAGLGCVRKPGVASWALVLRSARWDTLISSPVGIFDGGACAWPE